MGKLLKAEKQAEEMIQKAKQKRQENFKLVKERAEVELKVFKEDQESKFEKETGSKARADPTSELKGATEKGIAMVTSDYNANKARTVEYVTNKVLDVPLALTDTQKQ